LFCENTDFSVGFTSLPGRQARQPPLPPGGGNRFRAAAQARRILPGSKAKRDRREVCGCT
jgi:hypothetical protein